MSSQILAIKPNQRDNIKDVANIRLSVPQAGRTIGFSVKTWSNPLLSTFHSMVKKAEEKGLQTEIAKRYKDTFFPIIKAGDGFSFHPQQAVKFASSALLSIWMLSRLAHKNEKMLSLTDAENWFLEGAPKSVPGVSSIEGWLSENELEQLIPLSYEEDFIDLLPYILEIFEYTDKSQTSLDNFIEKGKRTNNHLLKRKSGIFYTPYDVTDFMSKEIMNSWEQINGQNYDDFYCLDPACGTGVFLLAMLKEIKSSYSRDSCKILNTAVRCFYGMDISPQAIQSCTFVILSECLKDIFNNQISLWRAWQAIRGNFAVIDSTKINGVGNQEIHNSRRQRINIRQALLNPNQEDMFQHFEYQKIKNKNYPSLSDIFEEISQGFSVLISNPPYSKISKKKHDNVFVSNGSGNSYTLFVEMMWRFTQPDNSLSGMIVPLSIAYHSGKAYKALRDNIKNINGEWTFHFFDRTPDSLFGDDVKTRNTIMFFKRDKYSINTIKSSQLQRWNSRNRSSLFKKLEIQSIRSIPIRDFIPKIGTEEEFVVYQSLSSFQNQIIALGENFSITKLSTCCEKEKRCLFYYNTAYNWLPIFRSIPTLSNSPIPKSLKALLFKNENGAKFFFVTASSRLAYWLWRVEGDGFHLNNSFLMRLPFNPVFFSEVDIKHLEDLADILWNKIQNYPIISNNSGKMTLNYCPYDCTDVIDEIDKIIINTYNINPAFLTFLKKFVVDTIIVNREKEPKYNEIFQIITKGIDDRYE